MSIGNLSDLLGIDPYELSRRSRVIKERRLNHPWPDDLCFCLPSDVICERAGLMIGLINTMASGDRLFMNIGKTDQSYDVEMLIRLIRHATPVLWKYDLLKTASTGCEVFAGTRLDPMDFAIPTQLWIPDRDMILSDEEAEQLGLDSGREWNAMGLLISYVGPEAGNGVRILIHEWNRESMDAPKLVVCELFCSEKPMPTFRAVMAWSGETVVPQVCGFVAAARFMWQPLVSIETITPDRAERRRCQRTGTKPLTVRYITLRRRPQARTETGEPVNWSCRWIVRAHWRRQWYPSTQEHKPALISSYVKGPEGMPFKKDSRPVVVVQR